MYKNKKLFYIFISILTLTTIIFVVLTGLYFFGDKDLDRDARTYTPSAKQIELIQGTKVKIPIVEDIRIQHNQDEAEVCFFNPKGQQYYLAYTLYIRGEMVYESKFIKPGKAIQKIKLNQSIPLGRYEAEIEIKSYEMESKKEAQGHRQRVHVEAYEK